jgi:hypothetical protein
MAESRKFHALHPGAILKEELEARGIAARGISAAMFVLRLLVPPRRRIR